MPTPFIFKTDMKYERYYRAQLLEVLGFLFFVVILLIVLIIFVDGQRDIVLLIMLFSAVTMFILWVFLLVHHIGFHLLEVVAIDKEKERYRYRGLLGSKSGAFDLKRIVKITAGSYRICIHAPGQLVVLHAIGDCGKFLELLEGYTGVFISSKAKGR